MADGSTLDRNLTLEVVRVTEAAAISASAMIGLGDEKMADQAAVDAMRSALNQLNIDGEVVIGEGERDEAPMLFIGEKVGTGNGPKVDIALDPLEGTTITAKGAPNSLAVLAVAEGGCLLNAPDVYMDKVAVGPEIPEGTVDIDKTADENVRAVAEALGKEPEDVVVCILDRPRHQDKIAAVRSLGARIRLIGDGDIAGVMETAMANSPIDLYMGSGGAPEGVLAAAALRCIGGHIQGRLLFRNDDERNRAYKVGIEDLDRKYSTTEMASGDVIFSATGVTDGWLLSGVKKTGRTIDTETVVMRSRSGTVRWIKGTKML